MFLSSVLNTSYKMDFPPFQTIITNFDQDWMEPHRRYYDRWRAEPQKNSYGQKLISDYEPFTEEQWEKMIPGYTRITFNEGLMPICDSSSLNSCTGVTENGGYDIGIEDDIFTEINKICPKDTYDALFGIDHEKFPTDDAFDEILKFSEDTLAKTKADQHNELYLIPDYSYDSYDDLDNLELMPNEFFKEESECSGISTQEDNIQPYTPDNDHCYSQPVHLMAIPDEGLKMKIVQTKIKTELPQHEQSDDDEVDVVTVTEECILPPVQRTVEPQRKTNRPHRNSRKQPKRTRTVLTPSSVKAAASAFRRTHKLKSKGSKRSMTNSVETSPSSSLACSDIEDYEKRNTHNDSERKRREAQRTALQDLRVCIPELEKNPKAAKVLILNTATKCIKQLKIDRKLSKKDIKRERHRQKILLAKLKYIQSILI